MADEPEERQAELAETVESILAGVREDLGDQTYPVSSEQVAAMYADRPQDLPNETEWIETAISRIDTSFEDEQAAYEALVTIFERGQHLDIRSDSKGPEPPYWEEERVDTAHDPSEDRDPINAPGYDSAVEESHERAREALTEEEGDDPEATDDERA